MSMQDQLLELFTHVAVTARNNPDRAAEVREALLGSGVLEVFRLSSADDEAGLDVLDLLEAGGEEGLRARLAQMTVPELRKVISAHDYDPQKQSARWRSLAKYIDLIVRGATRELEAESQPQPLPGAGWLL
ncbi:MAG TPA: hypothetical protein VF807_07450 [Ktedonobacterales bacterium]